ncbi:MAG: hypothetical protein JW940_29320 [Polyangiaceae bacterium]|nr:hypothetical protein [Polyangiaceae bacterium]
MAGGIAGTTLLLWLLSSVAAPALTLLGTAIPLLAAWYFARRHIAAERGSRAVPRQLRALARVLAEAAARPGEAPCGVEVTAREDGSHRVAWVDASPARSERLTRALAELVGPVLGQRYLLREPVARAPVSWLGEAVWRRSGEVRVFPVPRAFSRRSDAARLLECWQRLLDPSVTLHHRRSKVGRTLRSSHLQKRPLGGLAALTTVWE